MPDANISPGAGGDALKAPAQIGAGDSLASNGFTGTFTGINAPAVPAPHPDSVKSTNVAASVTNKSVTLPNGSVVQIDSKGNIVSGDPTNSAAAKTYAANQADTANASNAAKLAASQGVSSSASQGNYKVNSNGDIVDNTGSTVATKGNFDSVQKNGQALTGVDSSGNLVFGSSGAPNPFIATSDSVIAKEDALTSSLQAMNANDPAIAQAHTDYLSTLDAERAALEARRTQADANINGDFDAEKANEEVTQQGETGALNTLVRRAGGFLGMGASQTGALISLANSHKLTMQSLEAKRQDALLAANNAIDDKQFSLAEAKSKEAKDYLTAQNDAKQKYLEDQININKAQQDNVTFAQDQAKQSLTALSSLTPDDLAKVDPTTLKNIDDIYGVPGFAKNYIATTHAVNSAKSQSDAIAAQKNMLDLLQSIPNGQKITFPDPANPSGPGTTYTGMGKTGDISTFMETDNYGNNTLITFDKGSNTITRMAAGGGGKTSAAVDSAQQTSNRLNNISQFINDPSNKVLVSADPGNPNSPKYMTADNYVAMYQKYVNVYPGQGVEFLSQYPIQESVLPSQRKSTELNTVKQTEKQ